MLDIDTAKVCTTFTNMFASEDYRIITGCAGNVIRTLKSTQEDMPASQELEKAISVYYSSCSTTPFGQLDVWAQITPKERRKELPTGCATFESSLLLGDRFLKVLSGGGGWGHKKGLVALDPDPAFTADFEDDQRDRNDGVPFYNIVKPGDIVTFLAAPIHEDPTKPLATHRNLSKNVPQVLTIRTDEETCRFGAADSGFDKPVSPKSSSHQDPHKIDALVAISHFGALSAQGVSISIDVHAGPGEIHEGCEKLGHVVSTRLPPFIDIECGDKSSPWTVDSLAFQEEGTQAASPPQSG